MTPAHAAAKTTARTPTKTAARTAAGALTLLALLAPALLACGEEAPTPAPETLALAAPGHAPQGEQGPQVRREIQAVIRSRIPQIRACYEGALVNHPGLRGRLEVDLTIGADGRLSGAPEVKGFDQATQVQTCVQDELRTLVFSPPANGTLRVRYPFHLEPGKSAR